MCQGVRRARRCGRQVGKLPQLRSYTEADFELALVGGAAHAAYHVRNRSCFVELSDVDLLGVLDCVIDQRAKLVAGIRRFGQVMATSSAASVIVQAWRDPAFSTPPMGCRVAPKWLDPKFPGL